MVITDLMDNRALLQNHRLLLLLLLPPRGHQLLLLRKHRLLLLLLLPRGHRRGWRRLPKGHRLPEWCWKWWLMVLLHAGLLLMLHDGLLLLQQDGLLLLDDGLLHHGPHFHQHVATADAQVG